jgi:hypothetical protein
VIHRKMRGLLILLASGAAVAALSLAFLPASALAAGPATDCGGWLTKGTATAIDPNPIDYTFQCDWGITAYTIVANRQASDYSTIDDFDPDGLAYTPSSTGPTTTPVSGIDFDCNGQIPGNGINCALSSSYLAAPNFVEGWVDTSVPYCAYYPKGSTREVPQAIVSLIVTDTNGVEDGPFRLNLSPACPVAKAPTKPKPAKKKKTSKAKKSSAKHTNRTN